MDSDPDVALAPFDAVPPTLLRVIMLALPVDARAQAACVCRSWRAFLADVSLWQVLDLTPSGGVAAARVTENLVRGVVARAAGQLKQLSYNGLPQLEVVALVASDGAELHQLTTTTWLHVAELDTILAAAPRLQLLNVRVKGKYAELLPVLRNDPPYGPLRVSAVDVHGELSDAEVLAFAAAVAAHESLKGLNVYEVIFARGLNALVDAAAERRVSRFVMIECASFDAETVPALARLLQRSSLTTLVVEGDGFPHAPEESMPVLCAALRSCPTLTVLTVRLNPPDGASRHAITDLLDAAASLPALTELDLNGSTVQDTEDEDEDDDEDDEQDNVAFGRALGALLRANLPSLHTLRVDSCWLGDEGMAALLDGLAANTHLRWLDTDENYVSDDFEEDHLLPALAALAARPALAE
jgi:hypothetical protein